VFQDIAEENSDCHEREAQDETCCIHDHKPPVIAGIPGIPVDVTSGISRSLFKLPPLRRMAGKKLLDIPGIRPEVFSGSPSRQTVSRFPDGSGGDRVRQVGKMGVIQRGVLPAPGGAWGAGRGGQPLSLPVPMQMQVMMVVRRTTPVTEAREGDLFRKGRDIADALKEIPGVTATEYKAGGRSIRVIFAVPDGQAGGLIRRLLEEFRITPDLPGSGYRLGLYDTDERNILLLLDTDGDHAGAIRKALSRIRKS